MGLMGLIVGYSLATAAASPASQIAGGPAQVAPSNNNQPPPPPPPARDTPPVDASDHIRGDSDAIVSVIEYSDFECPFCSRVHPTLQKITDESDGNVNWVFRHFPLSFHQNAMLAAIASECINEFGGNDAFWTFVDAVFVNQGDWDYDKHAQNAGVDAVAFRTCFDSKKYQDDVQAEMDAGSAAGVSGTPGNIILNNKTGKAVQISGAQPFENFKNAIDEILK